jgi:hypothetical protein
LLDPPKIKLGSGLKPVNTPVFQSTPKPLTDQLEQVSESFQNDEVFGISESNVFALQVLNQVKSLISGHDANIQSITHNQYMESYLFQMREDFSRIDIGYNGKGKITRVSAPHSSDIDTELVKIISPLINQLIITVPLAETNQYQFDKEFLNEFHEQLIGLVETKDYQIREIKTNDWNIRYVFTRSQEIVTFDVFFNGKNIFTKYQAVKNQSNSSALISDIELLLTEGLGN